MTKENQIVLDERVKENQHLQEEEKLALDAVYLNQITYIKAHWHVWVPTNCHILLKALDSCFLNGDPLGKSKLSVILHVKCSEDYPQRKPAVDLLDPQGLSKEDVQNLLTILRQMADTWEGCVVIAELAHRVREFLTDHTPRPAGSFHDDMLANKVRTEAEKQRKRLDTEQKELELLEEEMRQRNAIEMEKTLNGTRQENETRIIGGRRIVVLSNMPNTQLLISEWTFRFSSNRNPAEGKRKDFAPFLQKLDAVYNEIQKLCEIKGLDQNLVEYAFVHLQKISVSPDQILIQLNVAQKIFSSEENMQDTYELIVQKSNLLRLLAAQAICGLRYLHEASMTHKHLTLGSVWTRNSTGDCVFRFSDFGSMGPLLDLVKMFGDICSGKYVARDEDKEKEYDRRRKDLFQLGTLLDGLILATRGSTYSRVPTPVEGNQNTGTNLLGNFIAKCQEAKNIDQLVEDPFLKEECQSESENIFTPFGGAMSPDGRMLADNVIIRVLGRGGFGDVVLVRNKMDSTDYAIKRIPLNAKSDKLNRKIAKEAKFFAKLNHPNMVRYYYAWAEDLIPIVEETSDDDSSLGAVPIPGKEKIGKKGKLKTGKSLEDKENKANLGGGDSLMPMNLRGLVKDHSIGVDAKEWSTPFGKPEGPKCASRMRQSKRSTPSGGLKHLSECSSDDEDDDDSSEIDWDAESEEVEDEESDDSDEEDEDDGERLVQLNTETSTGADSVFERSTADEDVVFTAESEDLNAKRRESIELMEINTTTTSKSKLAIDVVPVRKPRILCIQMEYCDRATLRQYIDENHCFNAPTEVWRIFSEVLCGLKYMHDMAMIHRDIKPLNIFLTSQNGVKIGDFGLATLEAMSSKGKIVGGAAEKSTSIEAMLSPNGVKSKGSDVHQTRDIGTQLYMAPELFVDELVHKAPYTSKIDIYSAGVVLFEMFYRPLPPSMDRVSTLNNLRDDIKIPSDFGAGLAAPMAGLARRTVEKMLQRNPDERPTADDLLNDEDLPMHTKEDATFRNLCEKVIKKRDGRMNAWLLDKQFKEEVPTSLNYCYDVDICLERAKYNNREVLVETLRAEFCKILKIHSFEKLHTHTLMPVSTALAAASVRTKPVEVLDRSGVPVALPMDLRQNFVRFCVRNSVQRMKRFNFGRVYSQTSANGHPHERWECCVDCIGPQCSSPSLEAELLLVACEMMIGSLPGMKFTLKIGHAQLIEAQIRHLKLSDDVRAELLDALHLISVSDRPHSHKEKMDMLTPKIGAKAANIITKLLIPVEDNFGAFKEKVACFRKKLKVDAARVLVDKAIRDLEEIVGTFKFCRTEAIEQISIVYDSQTCYRPRTFGDGLLFQIQVEKPSTIANNKRGRRQNVLAGGRYDSALLRERHPRDFVYEIPLCISGFGVAMDVVSQIRDSINKSANIPKTPQNHCKVLICSMVQPDGSNLITQKFELAKKLWSMGIEADVFHIPVDDLESLTEHRNRASITHILAVYNTLNEVICKTETSSETMDVDSAISSVWRGVQALDGQSIHMTPCGGGPISSISTPGEAHHHDDHHPGTPVIASKCFRSSVSTTVATTSIRPISATVANLNVILVTSADRFHKVMKEKKRVESQVRNHLTEFVAHFTSKTRIEVLVCDIPADVIKKIVSELTKTSSEAEIDKLFDQLIQKHGKVDLSPLRRQFHITLNGISTGSAQVAILFYRQSDNFYRYLV
ncbi:Eukaryotic translation initiation factor 2-alpha kinase gcn-2 [Caenorhabditis elegans]|uniref:Eukaryotic translation initiation factor 2-alpha kinase gcn-2 n=1 Tax=Caenorhabditis elegans TaxID=6239 RepID=E2AKB_CAEEL|nr:Eukaryotic translation initiation factor 2-alpha kinase gcn-2 [Caenorhabditis elegans]D0Z5N4.2 RecName: Full=Eukaryotic translation initiation factor 2-alpha kinase gcn-2; AltName: Full=General control nonderepressible kinase 2 [Caenorhabditis elegans]CBI63247.2 Eukaryotic translation initiation factor 2-alpha kinase gcn-2 [Caenorhabditis elegans]|eukprot:NP_001254370.2 Eukaryotic translation initiation factor 2-alpha kinase gcn-2 [Caenorhabditis elegans]